MSARRLSPGLPSGLVARHLTRTVLQARGCELTGVCRPECSTDSKNRQANLQRDRPRGHERDVATATATAASQPCVRSQPCMNPGPGKLIFVRTIRTWPKPALSLKLSASAARTTNADEVIVSQRRPAFRCRMSAPPAMTTAAIPAAAPHRCAHSSCACVARCVASAACSRASMDASSSSCERSAPSTARTCARGPCGGVRTPGESRPAGGTGKLKRTEEEGPAPSGATRPEQPRRSRAAEIAAWNSEPRGIQPMQMRQPWAARSCALEGSGGRLLSRPCALTPAVHAAPARLPRAALPRARAPPTA